MLSDDVNFEAVREFDVYWVQEAAPLKALTCEKYAGPSGQRFSILRSACVGSSALRACRRLGEASSLRAMDGVVALVLGWWLGFCSYWLGRRWCGRLLWQLLRSVGKPRRLWRVSGKTWEEEEAFGLPWLSEGCANCDYWDGLLGGDGAKRLHAAADHVAFCHEGKRRGVDAPDRSCSFTGSAAVAIWRCDEGAWLHRVDVARAEDALHLMWLLADAPHLKAQCAECRRGGQGSDRQLPADAADYLVHWGVGLWEVLLDRCSRGHRVHSVVLQPGSIPQWAERLAKEVVWKCYRRREQGQHVAEASWIDVWALVQEWRLRRVLDRL